MPFFFMLPMIIFRGMWDVALDSRLPLQPVIRPTGDRRK